ncbi:MAG: sugar phosphate isomerase/epimerase [Desulfosarcinaceae bacterium]|nr:sugar phosphate isomerase/epimerase [Desulfosarcinaceae bacterium]
MTQAFSLAHLTLIRCTPPELIQIAARTGYDYVGLRLIPMGVPGEGPSLLENPGLLQQTKAAFRDTGVKLLDLELARILPNIAPATYLPAMELAAELGARHVISSAWTTDPGDRDFVVDRYAEICDLASTFGLTVELEFPSFSRLTNLQEAAEIVRAADRSNGGILIDTLYFHLSQVQLEELERLPPQWIHFLHISDTAKQIPATREGKIHIARDDRRYVGEGCVDFAAIFARLPDVPYAIELPNARRVKALGYEGHARRCLETARQYVDTYCVTAGSNSA